MFWLTIASVDLLIETEEEHKLICGVYSRLPTGSRSALLDPLFVKHENINASET